MKSLTIRQTMMRARSAALLAVVGIGISAATATGGGWTELGPAPITAGFTGRVSAIVCSPTDPDTFYVAGADSGVWRTTTGGAAYQWQALTGDMPTTAIGALALDPTNESIIYAGTGESNYANHSRYGLGLYKSTDGGASWLQLAESTFAGRCFSRILVDPSNTQTVYAAITRAGGFPEMAAAKGHPQAAGPVGVFRSDDGGVTWTHLTNGLPALSATDLTMDPVDPQVLYAGIGRIFGDASNGIYVTTDGGASWTKLGGGLPTTNVGRVSVYVAPSMRQRLYALITEACDAAGGDAEMEGAYRSDDSGATWVSLPLTNPQATYGWYLSTITVQPTNPDVVFMGGVSLWRSTNAGQNWGTVTPQHVDIHATVWNADENLVCGNDGGVHVSDDLGSSWTGVNTGLGTIQFYAGLSIDPLYSNRILGGTQDNGTNMNHAVWQWNHFLGGDGGWTQIDQAEPRRLFGELQGTGQLYRSTDWGETMVGSANGIVGADRNCFLPPYLIDPTDSNKMIYATHRLYRSSDGGSSWTPVSGDLTTGSGAIRALAMAPSNPDVIYAATNDGNIQRSDDGGQTFTLIDSGVTGWPRVTRELFVDPTDPNTVYHAIATFGQTQIRRTYDGGQSWEALDASFPDVPVNVVIADVRGVRPVIYAGADNGIYWSLDEGGTWTRFGTGLPNAPAIDLVFDFPRNRMIAATQGRGAWLITIGTIGDMNCDGTVNNGDIDAFVMALTDEAAYAGSYPNCHLELADCNGDGWVTNGDIDPFVDLLAER